MGGLAFLLGIFRADFVKPEKVVRLRAAETSWTTGGFAPGGTYPLTVRDSLPPELATVGSWVDGDVWEGETSTAWLPCASAVVRVFVAGYPHHQGCALRAEFQIADGGTVQVAYGIADAHETWSPWDITVPRNATTLRLVAHDHAKDGGGWLAFSEPTHLPSRTASAAYMLAQVAATFALTTVLVWGPGLFWCRVANAPVRRVSVVMLGPMALAGIGIVVWSMTGIPAGKLSFAAMLVLWSALGWVLWRRSARAHLANLGDGFLRALAIGALLSAAGVAKASFSRGPQGELYGGTTHRSLAVGDRSDSRIPFSVVQAAAHHYGPASPQTEYYFTPWTFFSRGPLAGLVALPITLATGGTPPADVELRAWQPYDVTGFAAYRIVSVVLASSVCGAFFTALLLFVGEKPALVGTGLLALTPFAIHETMFTWPKLVCTACMLESFILVHLRRPWWGGITLGIAFLFHPLAALWTPWLAAWAMFRGSPSQRLLGGVKFSCAAAALMLPWIVAGKIAPHDPAATHAGQSSFIAYFRLAEYQENPEISRWLRTRWDNFSNTFVPFWLHLVNREHPVLNSVTGRSDAWVKFEFGWWNTLPLGAGLLLWTSMSLTIARTLRRYWKSVALLLVLPAIVLVLYWGASSTGLMRECGHPLLPAFIGLAVVAANSCGSRPLFLRRVFPWLQLPEAFLMTWLTTLLNQVPSGTDFATWDLLYAAINLGGIGSIALFVSRSSDDSTSRPEE